MENIEIVSSFFALEPQSSDISEDFLFLIDELNNKISHLNLPTSVECIYNPTIYARDPFEQYVHRYCNTKRSIMYFGMNPGPWGMSQTGVPFGEISSVRDWLNITGHVGKPPVEIKARPVKGFECTRSEVSGKRFWGLFKSLCETPDNFFKTSFVYNYLPQQWMKSNGCNVTPSDFKTSEMNALYDICDPILSKVLELYGVTTIIAIGKFCEKRAQKVLSKHGWKDMITIVYMPHPSPRVVNNNNWEEKVLKHLSEADILKNYNSN